MAAGVNFLKLFDADLGVNRGRVKFLMSKQLLDEPDVRPVFQHVRRAGVPQDVAAAFALQPGLGQPRRHHARDHVGIERAAVAGEEQRLRARVQAQTRTHGLQVMLQPVNGARADGHDAIFFSLAQTDMERAPFGVHVGQVKAAKLGAPDAASKKLPASSGRGCPADRSRPARRAAVRLRAMSARPGAAVFPCVAVPPRWQGCVG
jgi:hypothetical protein